jgi:methanogenic corrinoid protein MtbC1
MRNPGHDDDHQPQHTHARLLPALDSEADAAWAQSAPPRYRAQLIAHTIERQLIPDLARRHRTALAGVTEAELALFVNDLLQDDEAALRARVAHLMQHGLTAAVVCEDLLGGAARRLGCLWEDDRCDFVQVTLGVGLLHGLLRSFGPQLGGGAAAASGLRLLLAQLPQEQHTFGLSMLAHGFQAAGWAVSTTGGAGAQGAPAWVRAHFVDVVGFTIGSELLLEALRREIVAVRGASSNPAVVVMVGGPLMVLHPGWARELGADASPCRAQDAPVFAARLVAQAPR